MCKIWIAGSPELTHTKKEWAIMVIALFTSDFPTIQLCDHHILKHKPIPKSSTDPAHQYIESSVDKQVLPDWLERPGAPEAIEDWADLCGRYD